MPTPANLVVLEPIPGDKKITITGADFTIWVDNDDVPEGAYEFALELAAAFNKFRAPPCLP